MAFDLLSGLVFGQYVLQPASGAVLDVPRAEAHLAHTRLGELIPASPNRTRQAGAAKHRYATEPLGVQAIVMHGGSVPSRRRVPDRRPGGLGGDVR